MQELIAGNFNFSSINLLFVFTGIYLSMCTLFTARNYIQKKQKWYFAINAVYIFSFSLVILTTNWFLFMTAWELVTLVTALMLIWKSKRIARQYFIIQFAGSSLLLLVILLAIHFGYPRVGAIEEVWLQNLFILGVGTKSAIFGLHFWLPPVHSTAPSPVSAILSGWVVKLGFITLLKLIPEGNTLLMYLGFLMIFYGGFKALLATDFKVLLAFSSISQLGFIALAVSSGTIYGYLGAVFHIVAHGLAKTTLFLGSAYWAREYNTRSIYRFSRVFSRQRLNSITTTVAFISLMGFPLLAGYNSKYLIKHGFAGNAFLTILLHLASIVTVLYSLRFLKWGIFANLEVGLAGMNLKKGTASNPLDKTEVISLLPSTLLLICLGLFPGVLTGIISGHTYDTHIFTGILQTIGYLVLAGGLLYKLNWLRVEEKPPPSLDMYFKKVFNFIFFISARSKRFDTDVLFEDFLYQRIYNLSKKTRKFDTDVFFEDFLYQRIYNLSKKIRKFDTDVLFERFLYRKVYSWSRALYRTLFFGFQGQLLWIALFILLILCWNYLFI